MVWKAAFGPFLTPLEIFPDYTKCEKLWNKTLTQPRAISPELNLQKNKINAHY